MRFRIRHVAYAREYTRFVELSLTDVGATLNTWLTDLLRGLAQKSLDTPVDHGELDQLRSGLAILRGLKSWRRLIRQQPRDLKMGELIEVYRELEERQIKKCTSALIVHHGMTTVRKYIKRYLQGRSDCPQAVALNAKYKKRIRPAFVPRTLISDQVVVEEAQSLEPVGAISHSTFENLQKKAKARIEGDVERIRTAFESELLSGIRLIEWLNLIANEVRAPLVRLVFDTSKGNWERIWRKKIKDLPVRGVLREHLVRFNEKPRFAPALYAPFADQARVLSYVAKEMPETKIRRLHNLLQAPHIMTMNMLTSILVLLQIHSGWNVSSVLEMTIDGVRQGADGFVIQGYKRKTDQLTPPVWISPKEKLLFSAIQLLLRRFDFLKKNRKISEAERRIWISPLDYKGGSVISGFSKSLKLLRLKYSLPDFTFEQLRVQHLAKIYMGRGGIEVARQVAGHQSIKTTAHYLNQLIFNRLNSSINLEFQRRLERELLYYAGLKDGADRPFQSFQPENSMLYPVGDGSSCANPFAPPNDDWMQYGMCRAEHCHSGGGCENNKIVLNLDRLEEVVATVSYYKNNWRRLLDENSPSFFEVHLPAMIFAFALRGVVDKGPYGHLIRDLERKYGNTEAIS